jgi:hypothetical protein
VVGVEPCVHAAELRQAHRHVAVVEDDRDAEAVAQRGGNSLQMGHRDREHDDGVRPLPLDEAHQVPLPPRGDEAADRLARQAVERRVFR